MVKAGAFPAAVTGVGEWSGRGWVPELGPEALNCVPGHTGIAMERRTIECNREC